MIFLQVIGKNAPAFTVASLAMTMQSRPPTVPDRRDHAGRRRAAVLPVHVPGGEEPALEAAAPRRRRADRDARAPSDGPSRCCRSMPLGPPPAGSRRPAPGTPRSPRNSRLLVAAFLVVELMGHANPDSRDAPEAIRPAAAYQQRPRRFGLPSHLCLPRILAGPLHHPRRTSSCSEPSRFNELLQKMKEVEASDLHIKVGSPPVLRVASVLHRVEAPPLTARGHEQLLRPIIPDHLATDLEHRGGIDFSHHPGSRRSDSAAASSTPGTVCTPRSAA